MRVAIVGASGNVGTAVLRELAQTTEVSSVLGIARRLPDTSVEPYNTCDWAAIDIAAATTAATAIRQLEAAFRGVDVVIHLAWLVQPNTERDLLRRVNVEGTARVAQAAARAGVRHLVAASSVAAYSPDTEDTPRDESWATNGIQTSHYSTDKAAQERVLDEFETTHPEVQVTRMRTALVFWADAGAEIQRYFLGTWVPVQALRFGRLPVLPLPAGLRGVQAVHGEDAARAYVAAVLKGVPGAFNICADDILRPNDLAEIVDHGRHVEIPADAMRSMLATAHKMGAIAADEGWLDMAMTVPMMSNQKAKTELGWQPRYSAAEAVKSVLDGMIEGRGTDSVPMRPRQVGGMSFPSTDRVTAGGGGRGERSGDPRKPWRNPEVDDRPVVSDQIASDLLGLYLSDHLTGATAGAQRIKRMADAYIDTPVYAKLSELAIMIPGERQMLKEIIRDLRLAQRPHRQGAAFLAERAGRLKLNQRLFSRSPMSLVLETELMRSAVMGKKGVWQTLRDNAEHLGLNEDFVDELVVSADKQAAILDEVHQYARGRAFRQDLETFQPYLTDEADEESEEVDPDDELVDIWGEDSFPASDPPGNY